VRTVLFRVNEATIYLASHPHFACDRAAYLGNQTIGDSDAVGQSVAHFLHREPDATGPFLDTLSALHIGHLADARHQGQRSFEHPDDLAEGNLGRLAAQQVAAALPFLAVQEPVALQLQEDRLEKLLREPLPLRKLGDEYRSVVGLFGEHQHRFQAVFRLAGEHLASLYSIGRLVSGFGIRDSIAG